MQLNVNGQYHECQDGLSLRQALEHLGYEPKAIAVALDGQFVPKHRYNTCVLHDQQQLEVLSPMQGG